MAKFDKNDALGDLKEIGALLILIAIEAVIVGLALFAGQGAEQQSNIISAIFSDVWGLIGISGIVIFKIIHIMVRLFWGRKGDKKAGWVNSVIHDPEESVIPTKTKGFSWMKNPILVILIATVLFSFVGVFQVYQNTFFTELPARVPQQITEVSQGILYTIPADKEIWIPYFLGGVLISIFMWLKRNKKIDETTATILMFITVPLLTMLSWAGLHRFHHGSSDLAMSFVAGFGLALGLLLVLTKSVIWGWILKITVNLYQYLNGAIGSDEFILLLTLGINFLLVVIIITIFTVRKEVSSDG